MTAADPFVKAVDVTLTPDAMAQVAGFHCVLREPTVAGCGGGPRGAGTEVPDAAPPDTTAPRLLAAPTNVNREWTNSRRQRDALDR